MNQPSEFRRPTLSSRWDNEMVRLRRYNVENLAYFVTTSSFLSQPILLTKQRAGIITSHIYAAKNDFMVR